MGLMDIEWLQLAGCAAAIGWAGARLTRLADAIGAQTGMSGSWVGLVLLAAVTSLPELATGISAVTVADAPNIAVGDVLGSTVFNLGLLALLDLLHRPDTMYARAGSAHVLAAAWGIVLLAVVGAALLLEQAGALPSIGPVGLYSPLLLLLYLVALRSVHGHERAQPAVERPVDRGRARAPGLRATWLQFALSAAVVTVAGIGLPFVGGRIADEQGWSRTFVGTLLVAAATSLPEVVVTLTALRLRALDMAIGGLLGSNLFDLLVIAIDDAFHTRGPLLAQVSPLHALTAWFAVLMSAVVVMGLVHRPRRRVFATTTWAGLALLALYLANAWLLFVLPAPAAGAR